MKKIHPAHNNKDRIVFVSEHNVHRYFYQPAGSSKKYWLMDTPASISVYHYFRDHGRHIRDESYSMTMGELHRFDAYYNFKLCKLMERLPAQINYVLQELAEKADADDVA